MRPKGRSQTNADTEGSARLCTWPGAPKGHPLSSQQPGAPAGHPPPGPKNSFENLTSYKCPGRGRFVENVYLDRYACINDYVYA